MLAEGWRAEYVTWGWTGEERYSGDVTFRSIALYHSVNFDAQ